jgi:hypothetical protein
LDNPGLLGIHTFYIGDMDPQCVEEDKCTWLCDSLPHILHLYHIVHSGMGLGIPLVFFLDKLVSTGIRRLVYTQVLHK